MVIPALKSDIGRRVTLRELRLFIAAARSGSMLRAADEIGLTQPALSKSIADLERTLGVRLLERNSRGVRPTPHGEVLLRRATGVFEELRQAVDELGFLTDASRGQLRIGATPTLCAGLLPAVINGMLGSRPRFHFEAAELDSRKLAGEVLARSVDLAIGPEHIASENPQLAFERLFDDRLFIAAGPHHPLAGKRSLRFEELTRCRWVLPSPDASVTAQLRSEFQSRGLQPPEVAVTTMSVLIRSELIARGGFLTLLYGSVLRFASRPELLRVLPIDLPSGISVGALRLRDRTLAPGADLFVRAARETARPLGGLKAAALQRKRPTRR